MAHYAKQCNQCTYELKKCVEVCLKDENEKIFYQQMCECGNETCEVNRDILHGRRGLAMENEKEKIMKRRHYHDSRRKY